MTALVAGPCKVIKMDDNVDQLIHCAYLAGVSTGTLLEGVEQVRAVALQRLSRCEPRTSVRVAHSEGAMEDANAVDDTECVASEFVMVAEAADITAYPTVALTLTGGMPEIHTFMQLISQAVKESPPRQPMLDLLRGTKGQPLHILCQIEDPAREGAPAAKEARRPKRSTKLH